MPDRPAPEVVVDAELVADLLAAQHPDLADRPLELVERGWDNTNFRLGDDLAVRLPHRLAAAELIAHEQRWLPVLAPVLALAIPTPQRRGRPQGRYPWSWSITPWFDGEVAARADLDDPAADASRLGEFMAQLHRPAPPDAPTNPYRGLPLEQRQASFRENLAALDSRHDTEAIAAIFDHATSAPSGTRRVWLHGDLHTRNMIVTEGRLAAVIDWGDICAGDPACDLAAAYMLVPDHVEEVAAEAGASEAAWRRAKGWAAHFGVLYLLFGDDDPVMAAIGERLLTALLAD